MKRFSIFSSNKKANGVAANGAAPKAPTTVPSTTNDKVSSPLKEIKPEDIDTYFGNKYLSMAFPVHM
jgi:hypothetical protein